IMVAVGFPYPGSWARRAGPPASRKAEMRVKARACMTGEPRSKRLVSVRGDPAKDGRDVLGAAYSGIGHFPSGVHDHDLGRARHTVGADAGSLVVVERAVRRLMSLQVSAHPLRRLVDGDVHAKELNLVAELLVRSLDPREQLLAALAPGGPELEQHRFPAD